MFDHECIGKFKVYQAISGSFYELDISSTIKYYPVFDVLHFSRPDTISYLCPIIIGLLSIMVDNNEG
jgi:hypothetical protein